MSKITYSIKQVAVDRITFLNMLAILFVAFKLLDIIQWSWWWVLAPIWIPLAVIFLLSRVYGLLVAHAKSK